MNYDSVKNLVVEGVDMRDYPDFVDAYAVYAENAQGVALSEAELDILNDECQYIVQAYALDNLYGY